MHRPEDYRHMLPYAPPAHLRHIASPESVAAQLKQFAGFLAVPPDAARQEAFDEAVEDLTNEENDMSDQAAYTKPGGSYPGYVNIQRDHTGAYILTVRGDPAPALTAAEGAENPPLACGETVVTTIPEDDFHQLVALAQRLPVPREE